MAKQGTGQKTEQGATQPTAADVQQLIERANQEFNDYQRLTSQGKLAEAGQKLEALKQTLNELQQTTGRAKQANDQR